MSTVHEFVARSETERCHCGKPSDVSDLADGLKGYCWVHYSERWRLKCAEHVSWLQQIADAMFGTRPPWGYEMVSYQRMADEITKKARELTKIPPSAGYVETNPS